MGNHFIPNIHELNKFGIGIAKKITKLNKKKQIKNSGLELKLKASIKQTWV